jgi:hypothetical protein
MASYLPSYTFSIEILIKKIHTEAWKAATTEEINNSWNLEGISTKQKNQFEKLNGLVRSKSKSQENINISRFYKMRDVMQGIGYIGDGKRKQNIEQWGNSEVGNDKTTSVPRKGPSGEDWNQEGICKRRSDGSVCW